MKKLNKYIFEENNKLINLVTKKILSKESTEEELRKNFFLKNQEQNCINEFLFRKPNYLSLKIIPTWECNLRCSHCFVLHQLVKKDKGQIEIDKLIKFVKDYVKKYNVENIIICFLGGEPALKAKENLKIIEAIKKEHNKTTFRATTNLIKINKEILNFYNNLDLIQVSLDGSETSHNNQRKSIEGIKNPYKKTLKNIKKLVQNGMREKIIVQASLNDEEYNEKNIVKFYEDLLVAGVELGNITYGCNVPTKTNSNDVNNFFEVCKKADIKRLPCCTYRFMSELMLDSSNNFYCDYFDTKNTFLGKITDDIDAIENNHKNIILKQMPVLQDENCMKCPVIGACWGECSNSKNIAKPSQLCDQKKLHEKIKEKCKNNELIKLISNKTKPELDCLNK